MKHITGIVRNQMVFSSLEETILPDNPVRFIDAFVNNIDSATAFGMTGINPRGKGKMGFDWVLIKTMPKLGVEPQKRLGDSAESHFRNNHKLLLMFKLYFFALGLRILKTNKNLFIRITLFYFKE